jgi:hypothetical protein
MESILDYRLESHLQLLQFVLSVILTHNSCFIFLIY